MDAEIKRTVISNIGFKIRDTTAPAALPDGEKRGRSLAILLSLPQPTGCPEDFRLQETEKQGNRQLWN